MNRQILLIFVLMIVAGVSVAQDRPYMIDSVEVVATGKVAERTIQRTIIDTTILQSMQNSTLGDLLIQNSSVNIKSYGRGDVQSATFRGTAPSHTAVYWNGVKINSPMAGAVDFSLIPVFFIDKLSIDAGVSAMATTTGALGGAINIESAPDWSKPFSVEAVQSYGSFATTDSYLNIKAGNSRFQSSTKLLYTYSKNDFPFVNRDIIDPSNPDYRPTQRNENASYHRSGFMQEFYYRLDSVQMLTAAVWGLLGDSDIPQLTTYEGSDANNLTNRRDASLRAAVTYKRYGQKTQLTVRATADLQDMSFLQQNRVSNGYQTTIDSHGLSRSAAVSGEMMFSYFANHAISLNATAAVDMVDSRESVRDQGFNRTRGEGALTAALHSTWGERWLSMLAVRGSLIGDNFFATPFAGVEYRLTTPFSLKARVGYNVHTPTLSDLYYVPGGNMDLKSERSLTAEVGGHYKRGDFKVDVNLFSSWISDWIIWLPTHNQYWTPQNIKTVLSRGVELTASSLWRWGDWGLFGNFNLTFNHTINNGEPIRDGDESVGKQLVYVPLLSGGVYLKGNWRKLWFSYQIYGESERYTTTANNSSVYSTIAPYTLSDMAVGYSWRWIGLEFKCRNVFDSQYYTVLRRPLPGRSFEATLRFKL